MNVLKRSPAWSELAPREAEVVAWVDDFLAYASEEDEGGEQ